MTHRTDPRPYSGLILLLIGCMCLLFTLPAWFALLAPRRWGYARFYVMIALWILACLGVWLSGRFVRRLKRELLEPRAGYAKPRISRLLWVASLSAGAATIVPYSFLYQRTMQQPAFTPVLMGSVMAVGLWAFALILRCWRLTLFGAFSVVLGILLWALGVGEMRPVPLVSILAFGSMFGAVSLIWGALILRRFVRDTPVDEVTM